MEARYLALLILAPFAVIFAYCTWHEYKRFKTEGRSTYGLSYDRETNTTHVGPIDEDEEAFDPDAFDPDLLETEAKQEDQGDGNDDDSSPASDTEPPEDTDKPQDSRT